MSRIVTFDNSMLSILKVNHSPAAKGRASRMGLCSYKTRKNAAWLVHAAFFHRLGKRGYSVTFCLFHQLCHFFNNDMAQLVLAHLRILFHMPVLVQERCDVCRAVEAGARHGHVVRDKHIEVLSLEL